MPHPTKDCDCEDFPCCEHADNFPVEDNPQMYYCDICGFSHAGPCPVEDDYDDEDEEPKSLSLIAGGDAMRRTAAEGF